MSATDGNGVQVTTSPPMADASFFLGVCDRAIRPDNSPAQMACTSRSAAAAIWSHRLVRKAFP